MSRLITNWKFTYALAFGLLIAMIALRFADPLPLQIMRNKTFDIFQRIEPRQMPTDQIVPVRIIDIDDESLEALGQWPWPRTLIAEIVRTLVDDYGVAVVAFDIVFAEPDRLSPGIYAGRLHDELSPELYEQLSELPSNDDVLAATMAGRPVVLGQATIPRGDPPETDDLPRKAGIAVRNITPYDLPPISAPLLDFANIERNLPELEATASGIGFFSFFPDSDNIVRRVPLLLNVDGNIYPALSIEALRVALGRPSIMIEQDAWGPTSVKLTADFALPTDSTGHGWVHYAPYTRDRYVSVVDVLDHTAPPQMLAGHVVILGTSAAGLQDIRATPLEDALPGVEVHAQLLENLLTQTTLNRPNFSLWLDYIVIIAAGLMLALMVPFGGALWSLVGVSVVVAGVTGGSWYLFKDKQQLVAFAYPVICIIALYMFFTFMNYMREEQQKKQVRGAFAQYLSPAMVEQLAKDPDRLQLGGEMRTMTLFFSDIRGFTTISEQFRGNPVGLVSLINRFLTPMTGIILDHKGTIDKYMGDCIMAFWNAPMEDDDQIVNSLEAGITMIEEVDRLNDELEKECEEEGRPFFPIKVGVGINTGEVFVGNMGSDQRFDYSVIGDDVNLAARLEGQSKTYGVVIVIGDQTKQGADDFATLELDLIKVKGKKTAVRIFTLVGRADVRDSKVFQKLAPLHQTMLDTYRAQEWDKAVALSTECRAMMPQLDGLYEAFCERVQEFRDNPPGPDWDGAYTATTK
ncbi:MAG: adenylate/guanylate cyclase domain-containing protein [Rhodospirillaceae bacterium]|nr:adenylate/guanylate cyclase domain-containing protein [Rhodospirillaceae bacterium]MBT6206040.1 adenylate/guanylate cyclase domain-containing protein [Rhodospirillaceae bacterium]MBT6510864.1 adenylate/guanylate cyclase domain-containing protein [Rhodospirillaceae bacterium]MBT7613145.1 adenylate/guanylate cyclase domain-containing protein [Rhodospirillaceae bacterium]MBT7645995.1 adenylate/guanylate cyclase domain-containing protein [Rhodospirillaceae bacterium]